jgi:predicted nucleic acid-binding protein
VALSARYLLDTSAMARIARTAVRERITPLIERGLVASCALLDLEAGYSARSVEEYDQIMTDRRLLYSWVPMPDDALSRVGHLQRLLVDAGTHRGVGLGDLLIAVTAQAHDLTVLHYDHDFDLIAAVLPVSVAWVVPAGTVP